MQCNNVVPAKERCRYVEKSVTQLPRRFFECLQYTVVEYGRDLEPSRLLETLNRCNCAVGHSVTESDIKAQCEQLLVKRGNHLMVVTGG